MSQPPENERSALIRKRLEAESLEDENLDEQQKEASVGFLWRLWYGLRGYALEDIVRLREAGVSMVEGNADQKHVANKKTDAEAEKAYMEAEVLRQEAAKKNMEARSKELEIERERLEIEKERLALEEEQAEAAERKAEAYERVRQAVRAIKAKGGEVLFDSDQIEAELSQLESAAEDAAQEQEGS